MKAIIICISESFTGLHQVLMACLRIFCRNDVEKAGTPGSAAVVEGHLVAVGVREREGAAERPVGGR
jgi:hypothetical protein